LPTENGQAARGIGNESAAALLALGKSLTRTTFQHFIVCFAIGLEMILFKRIPAIT